MTDFDFDELDKAVAGALGDDGAPLSNSAPIAGSSDAVPSDTSAEKSSDSDEQSRPASLSESAEVREVSPEPRVAPAARRSSGRYMDVVYPTSDMRSRQGFTPPASASTESPTPTQTPPTPAPTQTPEDASSHTESEDESTPKNAWGAPLESPFLPDAKVEKRPLGSMEPTAFTPFTSFGSTPAEPLLSAPDEPLLEATTMPDPIDFAAHASALPSEQEDTGSTQVEATTEMPTPAPSDELSFNELDLSTPPANVPAEEATSPAEAPTEGVGELVTPENSEQEASSSEPLEDTSAANAESTPAPTPLTPTSDEPAGPTSITQQYTEQPRDTQPSGAIYDTENYHQPLAVDPKKRSGAWVILWIVLLVILGAGAGVAFYLFVLPML